MPVFPSPAAAESFSKKAAAIATAFLLNVFREALSFSQMYEIVVDTATL